ncbi:MAG: tetratricopeptide repeat protein, partial [Candidatus Electrothrix sp. AUS4]|nr:tetratricopeptide repeat protein [Candidatus Electrothrix sp. AUS4]
MFDKTKWDKPCILKGIITICLIILVTGILRHSINISKELHDKKNPAIAVTQKNLAEFYRRQGRYDEAEPLYKNSLQIFERAFGKDHPDRAITLNNLAQLYYEQGRYDEAEPLYKSSLEISGKVLGKYHHKPNT